MTILVGGCNEKFRSDEQKGSCRFQDLVPQKTGPETGHGALVGILRQDGVAAVLPRRIDELDYDLRLCDGFITLIDEDRNFSPTTDRWPSPSPSISNKQQLSTSVDGMDHEPWRCYPGSSRGLSRAGRRRAERRRT